MTQDTAKGISRAFLTLPAAPAAPKKRPAAPGYKERYRAVACYSARMAAFTFSAVPRSIVARP